jgi:hypothetical protein
VITNVLAEIDGIEFLQPVLQRFGDYDPNVFDFTYDPPDAIIGDGETIASYCRKLPYIFQTMNGPGGTAQEINLDQWELTWNMQFDPLCAAESLIWYRRMLENGECENSFWTGKPPGQYTANRWCTILKYFHVEIPRESPNKIRFRPKSYHLLVNGIFPQGIYLVALNLGVNV